MLQGIAYMNGLYGAIGEFTADKIAKVTFDPTYGYASSTDLEVLGIFQALITVTSNIGERLGKKPLTSLDRTTGVITSSVAELIRDVSKELLTKKTTTLTEAEKSLLSMITTADQGGTNYKNLIRQIVEYADDLRLAFDKIYVEMQANPKAFKSYTAYYVGAGVLAAGVAAFFLLRKKPAAF